MINVFAKAENNNNIVNGIQTHKLKTCTSHVTFNSLRMALWDIYLSNDKYKINNIFLYLPMYVTPYLTFISDSGFHSIYSLSQSFCKTSKCIN